MASGRKLFLTLKFVKDQDWLLVIYEKLSWLATWLVYFIEQICSLFSIPWNNVMLLSELRMEYEIKSFQTEYESWVECSRQNFKMALRFPAPGIYFSQLFKQILIWVLLWNDFIDVVKMI